MRLRPILRAGPGTVSLRCRCNGSFREGMDLKGSRRPYNSMMHIALQVRSGVGVGRPAFCPSSRQRAPLSLDPYAAMSAPTRTAPIQDASPVLALCALSDSFAAVWPRLASEAGLALETLGRTDPLPQETGPQVVLLAVGGAEALTEEALEWLRGAGISPAVVGGVPDHHLAQRAVRAGAAAYFALPDDLQLLRDWLAAEAGRIRLRAGSERFASREAA